MTVKVTNAGFLAKTLDELRPKLEAQIRQAVLAEMRRIAGFREPLRRSTRKKATRRRPARARRARGGKS